MEPYLVLPEESVEITRLQGLISYLQSVKLEDYNIVLKTSGPNYPDATVGFLPSELVSDLYSFVEHYYHLATFSIDTMPSTGVQIMDSILRVHNQRVLVKLPEGVDPRVLAEQVREQERARLQEETDERVARIKQEKAKDKAFVQTEKAKRERALNDFKEDRVKSGAKAKRVVKSYKNGLAAKKNKGGGGGEKRAGEMGEKK